MTQLLQPFDPVDAVLAGVAEHGEEYRVGLDHVRGRIPFPRADLSSGLGQVQALHVFRKRVPSYDLIGDFNGVNQNAFDRSIGIAEWLIYEIPIAFLG